MHSIADDHSGFAYTELRPDERTSASPGSSSSRSLSVALLTVVTDRRTATEQRKRFASLFDRTWQGDKQGRRRGCYAREPFVEHFEAADELA